MAKTLDKFYPRLGKLMFFGMGFAEMVVIFAITLVLFAPRMSRLGTAFKKFGREFRHGLSDDASTMDGSTREKASGGQVHADRPVATQHAHWPQSAWVLVALALLAALGATWVARS